MEPLGYVKHFEQKSTIIDFLSNINVMTARKLQRLHMSLDIGFA